MRIAALMFAALLLSASVLAQPVTDGERCAAPQGTADERMAACTRAINSGRLSAAEQAFTLIHRGILWDDKGETSAAIADYSEAIRIEPRFAEAYQLRGDAWRGKGDHDWAIADYTESIRINPEEDTAYYYRGLAWYAKGDLDRAIADYGDAIRIHPKNARTYYNRGNAWMAKGDNDRAIADYSESLRINPRNAAANEHRASAWLAKGEFDRAGADYNEAIRLSPRNAQALQNRGRLHFHRGDFAAAATAFEETLRVDPRSAYAWILRYLAQGRERGDAFARKSLIDGAPAVDPKAWPAPLLELFAGRSTPEAVFRAAEHPDGKTRRGQLCEAAFYLGEHALIVNQPAQARSLLETAARDCPTDFYEFADAALELKRLSR